MTTKQSLVTVDDLWDLPDDGCRYELIEGELIKMAPVGGQHGRIAFSIAYRLGRYLEANPLGEILVGEPGVVLQRGPDTVRAPDVCFIARERVTGGEVPAGFLEIVPNLIVEVVSPGDRAGEVQAKVEEWLRSGARLVWVVYPTLRSVAAFRSEGASRVYTADDTLDAEPVLPDFTCPLAEIFR